MSEESTKVVDQSPTLGDVSPLGDDDPQQTGLAGVHLDGSLVLVGCGKAKRDPDDPVDVHEAAVAPGEEFHEHGRETTGPAWEARDLYTSTYFATKREFAETVTAWTNAHDSRNWMILSAEHKLLAPTEKVTPYDTTISDLGDDPMNMNHHINSGIERRRPDGQPIVTEMDQWAAGVAAGLARWVAQYREQGQKPWETAVNDLIVLAGKDYVEPLRERGVFEYGIARMGRDPNEGYKLPVETRFLFEEIDAGGIGEQMAWLSDTIDRLEPMLNDADGGFQTQLNARADGGEQ